MPRAINITYLYPDAIYYTHSTRNGRYWPFLAIGKLYTLLCVIASKPLAMKGPLYNIKDKLIELRKLEQIALAEFTESKNRLLAIKKEIQKLENLLKPNLS